MKFKQSLLLGLVLAMSVFTVSASVLGDIAITPNNPATTKENVDRLTLESIESYVDLSKSMTPAFSLGSSSSLGSVAGLDAVTLETSIQDAKDAADAAADTADMAADAAEVADTKATSANNLTSNLTTLKTVNGACSPDGSLSKTSTGELLVCQSGSWADAVTSNKYEKVPRIYSWSWNYESTHSNKIAFNTSNGSLFKLKQVDMHAYNDGANRVTQTSIVNHSSLTKITFDAAAQWWGSGHRGCKVRVKNGANGALMHGIKGSSHQGSQGEGYLYWSVYQPSAGANYCGVRIYVDEYVPLGNTVVGVP